MWECPYDVIGSQQDSTAEGYLFKVQQPMGLFTYYVSQPRGKEFGKACAGVIYTQ